MTEPLPDLDPIPEDDEALHISDHALEQALAG